MFWQSVLDVLSYGTAIQGVLAGLFFIGWLVDRFSGEKGDQELFYEFFWVWFYTVWFGLTLLGFYNDLTSQPRFKITLIVFEKNLLWIGISILGTIFCLICGPFQIFKKGLFHWRERRKKISLRDEVFGKMKGDIANGFGNLEAKINFAPNHKIKWDISFATETEDVKQIVPAARKFYQKLLVEEVNYRTQLGSYIKKMREEFGFPMPLEAAEIAANLKLSEVYYNFNERGSTLIYYENFNSFGLESINVVVTKIGKLLLCANIGFFDYIEEMRYKSIVRKKRVALRKASKVGLPSPDKEEIRFENKENVFSCHEEFITPNDKNPDQDHEIKTSYL